MTTRFEKMLDARCLIENTLLCTEATLSLSGVRNPVSGIGYKGAGTFAAMY
ncbi:MAG: hypothetical protein WCA08_04645 [Desulfoferrobacter sp.]